MEGESRRRKRNGGEKIVTEGLLVGGRRLKLLGFGIAKWWRKEGL